MYIHHYYSFIFEDTEEPLPCDIFMAPSKVGGFGVFAARDFVLDEVVEMAPLFLPMDKSAPVMMNSVLSDYQYGYDRGEESMGLVAMGDIMFYNHERQPNLLYTTHLGHGEPSESHPDSVGVAVFVAKRNITKGEELFSSYGLEDGGAAWFAARRIPMAPADTISKSNIAPQELDQYRRDYCSKSFAGVGSLTYNTHMKRETEHYKFQAETLPSADAPSAVARVSIKAGNRIEIAPALVLSRELVKGTALAPFGMNWEDLSQQHHDALKELRTAGKLKVQHQSKKTEWHRLDHFKTFEDVVIFPAAGNIAQIDRMGTNDPNCRMNVMSSGKETEGADLVLEMVALKDITAGETLRLDIVPTGTVEEKLALKEILEPTGQPLSDNLKAVKAGKLGGDGEL